MSKGPHDFSRGNTGSAKKGIHESGKGQPGSSTSGAHQVGQAPSGDMSTVAKVAKGSSSPAPVGKPTGKAPQTVETTNMQSIKKVADGKQ